jgi:hypothetical protein
MPTLHILVNHANTIHTFPYHLLKIHFNIILPSTPRSVKCFHSFRYHVVCISLLLHACHLTGALHSLSFNHQDNVMLCYVMFGAQIMKLLITQFSPSSCYFSPLRHKYSLQYLIKAILMELHPYRQHAPK